MHTRPIPGRAIHSLISPCRCPLCPADLPSPEDRGFSTPPAAVPLPCRLPPLPLHRTFVLCESKSKIPPHRTSLAKSTTQQHSVNARASSASLTIKNTVYSSGHSLTNTPLRGASLQPQPHPRNAQPNQDFLGPHRSHLSRRGYQTLFFIFASGRVCEKVVHWESTIFWRRSTRQTELYNPTPVNRRSPNHTQSRCRSPR